MKMEDKMNILFLVIGHSGSGKTSVMRKAMGTEKEIVSYTTREKRLEDGEVDGIDYYFINDEAFNRLKYNNQLVEYVEYAGSQYGFSQKEVRSKLIKDHAFAIVTQHGAEQLKALYPRTVTIFIHTPLDEAAKRMLNRGDEHHKVATRIKSYQTDMLSKNFCDYVIRNNHGQFNSTVDIIKTIIDSERGYSYF